MTKLILGLVVAKLIEEGLTSMSSTTVLPFLSYTAKYYDEAMSIQTFDMTTLTVRDFLGFKSGLFGCILYDVDFIGFNRANNGVYPGTPAEDAHCAQGCTRRRTPPASAPTKPTDSTSSTLGNSERRPSSTAPLSRGSRCSRSRT